MEKITGNDLMHSNLANRSNRFIGNRINLRLLCFGYVRLFFEKLYINDIATVVFNYADDIIDWKFDYFYDFGNYGKRINLHCIEKNGKTIKCICRFGCGCFFCSHSFATS